MKLNLLDKANLVVAAARNKHMSGRIWTKDICEVRVYLTRTNAGRTEAGYIRLWVELDQNGKKVSKSKLVCDEGGKGSRTALMEAESVYAEYKSLRDAALSMPSPTTPTTDDNAASGAM